jgi:heat-inducible transcriptional repressor
MAALEDMGYLTHPHTSAGRVPTELGYRFYVDHLLTIPPVSNQEMENLSQAISHKGEDLRQLLVEVCRLISTITTYASIALTPHFHQLILKRLHFVPISSKATLVIIVTSAKIIQSSLAETQEDVTEEQLEDLSRILSRQIDGKTPWEALQAIQVLREGPLKQYAFLLGQIHSFIHEVFLFEQRERLIVEGEENVLLSPELQDLGKLRTLISALDRRFLLQEFLERKLTSKSLQVIIGGENEFFELRDLALLAMPFETSSYNWGALGLVGPMRMDYAKAIRTLSCVTNILERNLQKEGV